LLSAETINFFFQANRLKHRADKLVIRQTTDVSCGPAALASLLKFYFGEHSVTEHEIATLAGTYSKGTTSLLDLRNICRVKGYEARGLGKMTLPQLIHEVEHSGTPVIVHFENPYRHFSLVLGQVRDYILVSDPSRGNVSMKVDEFLGKWDNVALVVKNTPPHNQSLIEKHKRSTEIRLQTLDRASALISMPRF